jgi:hypothetical protein
LAGFNLATHKVKSPRWQAETILQYSAKLTKPTPTKCRGRFFIHPKITQCYYLFQRNTNEINTAPRTALVEELEVAEGSGEGSGEEPDEPAEPAEPAEN